LYFTDCEIGLVWSKSIEWKKTYNLLLIIEISHGIGKSLSRALNLVNGLGSTLNLVAALAGVATPLLKSSGVSLGHSFGESVGGTLNVASDIGGALHHVAALTGVTAPLLKTASSDGLGGASDHNGESDGVELHLDGLVEKELKWVDWKEWIDRKPGRRWDLCWRWMR
jgi:hypothetical protein